MFDSIHEVHYMAKCHGKELQNSAKKHGAETDRIKPKRLPLIFQNVAVLFQRLKSKEED